MCGIVGIAGVMPVNQSIYDALTVLQHRGQDAAGIITIDANNCFRLRKANGLVNDILKLATCSVAGQHGDWPCTLPYRRQLQRFGSATFYVNSPYGITLAHNGNLTNAHELRKKLLKKSAAISTPPPIPKSCSIFSPASSTTSVTIRWKPTIFLPRLPRLTVKSAAPMPAWR